MEFKHVVVALLGVVLALATGALSQTCSDDICQLPNCLCPAQAPPAGLAPAEIPQIVFMTFDDGITVTNFAMYEELLFHRLNPNGAPISATFFTTHEYTDYNKTRFLWEYGHEIALHSISHQVVPDYWLNLSPDGWRQEIVDQKYQLTHFANLPPSEVTGMRAPFLQTGGDVMMRELQGELNYDCSRPTLNYIEPGLWPYTLDYNNERYPDCQIEPCPVESYPGFWTVPMVDWIGGNNAPCAMLDTCLPDPNTTEAVMELFQRNFNRHYLGNKAPFGLFSHAAWLDATKPGHKEGFIEFLDYLDTLEDVYIVSIQKGLEWMRSPTSLDSIQGFGPWQHVERPRGCNVFNCEFDAEDTPFPDERFMVSCKVCPPKYPWLGDPFGDGF